MSDKKWPDKDPNDVDWRYVVWCDEDGTNDGGVSDDGDLQGETISTSSFAIAPSGELAEDLSNTDSVTVRGVVYPIDTVSAIRLSGGEDHTQYTVTCTITTSGGRTLERSVIQRVKER